MFADKESAKDRSIHRPDFLVYVFTSCSFVLLVALFLLGIFLYHVPWLGVFAILSVFPGWVILYAVYWKNHRDVAAFPRVVKYFCFGIVGVFPIAVIEFGATKLAGLWENALIGHVPSLVTVILGCFVGAFFVAALFEESYKLLLCSVITVQVGRDVPYSVVVYAVAGAVGLATLENLLYIMSVASTGNFLLSCFTASTRAVMAVPLHATTGMLLGTSIARKRFLMGQCASYPRMLIIPIVLHGLYDFFVMIASALLLSSGSLVLVVVLPLLSLFVVCVGVWHANRCREQLLVDSFDFFGSNVITTHTPLLDELMLVSV